MQKNDGALTFLGLIISAILVVALVFIFAKTFPDNQLSADAQQYLLESMESVGDEAHSDDSEMADEHEENGNEAEGESGDGEHD
jgi:hypothetical protein